MSNPSRVQAKVGPEGRVVIPANMRHELHIQPGDVLVFQLDDGKLVLEKLDDVLDRLQGRLKKNESEGSQVDEFIAWRREEAKREEKELRG